MKNFKRFICLLLALSLFSTMVSCRKTNDDYSSGYSVITQQEIITDGDETGEESGVNSTTNHNSSSSGSSKPTGSSNNASGSNNNNNNNNNNSTASGTQLPAYTGNLPTIAMGKIPSFASKQFETSGFWAPYEISEDSFKQYKDVGFTSLAMINHSLEKTSENQFYLGSKRTMKALEMCRKVGLTATINYNDWIGPAIEGENYFSDTPFSQHDVYGAYKDIITGVHIVDEPYVKHIEQYTKPSMIEDFKKVYPNADYVINLINIGALESRGFNSYEEMIQIFDEKVLSKFDKPYLSVDVYPFRRKDNDGGINARTIAQNYEYIANATKKYGTKPAYILQSSTGNEFQNNLSESDLRWEVNIAMAFGTDTMQFYCYANPKSGNEFLYNYCILNSDNTPSPIYYSLQKVLKEAQSYASVILAYDWQQTIGATGNTKTTYRISNMEYDDKFNLKKFENAKHYVSVKSTHDLLISRFENSNYGEAYMFVNFADRGGDSTSDIKFRDCKAVAIYGGAGFSGTPKVVNLDASGNLELKLKYGEGVFVIPLA